MGASLGTLPPLGFCTCCSLAWSTLLIALSVAPLLLVLSSVFFSLKSFLTEETVVCLLELSIVWILLIVSP